MPMPCSPSGISISEGDGGVKMTLFQRAGPFFKTFSLLLVTASVVGTIAIGSDYRGLDFTHGVKAAMLALASATAWFSHLIPVNSWPLRRAAELWERLISVIAAFCAGGFWLWHETDGNPLPYLYLVIGLGFASGIAIMMAFFLPDMLEKERRK